MRLRMTELLRKCGKKECPRNVAFDSPFKMCQTCREIGRKSKKGAAANKLRRIELELRTRKCCIKKCNGRVELDDNHKKCEKCRGQARRHANSQVGKEGQLRRTAKYRKTEKGKSMQRRYSSQCLVRLRSSLYSMVSGNHQDPLTLPSFGFFVDNQSAQDHFENQFQPWMSWDNHGNHLAEAPYNTAWQIGHHIPIAAFDGGCEEDVRRCFHPDNLYPQCARENIEQKAKIPDADWLSSHVHLHPQSWAASAVSDSD